MPYEWQLNIDSSIIKSTENFNNTGNTATLTNGGSFLNLTNKISFVNRRRKDWHIYGGTDINYSQSNLGVEQRTNSKINSFHFGSNFNKVYKKVEFVPIAEATLAFTKVDSSNDETLIGDGASVLKLGTWVKTKYKSFLPYAYAGIDYKTDDLASPYYLILGSAWPLRHSLLFIELNYINNWRGDSYANQPNSRWNLINRVNGGSYYFYSVNPTHTDFAIGTQILWTKDISTTFALNSILEGQRYAKGFQFLFNLNWGFGNSDEVRAVIEPKNKKSKSQPPSEFREKLEDEDQTLFEE